MTITSEPLTAIEAFIAGVDDINAALARCSSAFDAGAQRLEQAESELTAALGALRERALVFVSAAEAPCQTAIEALDALAGYALPPDAHGAHAPSTAELDGLASDARETIGRAATQLVEADFAALAHTRAQLATDLEHLDSQTAGAVEAAGSACHDLSRRLDRGREDVAAALRAATLERAAPALAALEESLRELRHFGDETATSLDRMIGEAGERVERILEDLSKASEGSHAEWLAEIDRLATDAERQLRTSVLGQIETRLERFKQETVQKSGTALDDANAQAESVQARAPKVESLVPQVMSAKQAVLTMAEVMGAIGA